MLNIVIPMAGRGSRFLKEGYIDPKPLIPLAKNKRMIEVVVNNIRPKEPHRFIFICQKEHAENYALSEVLERAAPGCVIVTIENITEGAACTVMQAEHIIDNDNPLMIANSDQWVDIDINDYLTYMTDRRLSGLIMTMTACDPKWSYAEINSEGYVTRVAEKEVVSHDATVGIYNFRRGRDFCRNAKKMIAAKEQTNGEYYVAPVYTWMYREDNAQVGVFNIGSEADGMYGLGIPSDLEHFLSLKVAKKALEF